MIFCVFVCICYLFLTSEHIIHRIRGYLLVHLCSVSLGFLMEFFKNYKNLLFSSYFPKKGRHLSRPSGISIFISAFTPRCRGNASDIPAAKSRYIF